MKKILILWFLVLTFFSCADPGGERIFDGFSFTFYEYTGEDYDIEIVIDRLEAKENNRKKRNALFSKCP